MKTVQTLKTANKNLLCNYGGDVWYCTKQNQFLKRATIREWNWAMDNWGKIPQFKTLELPIFDSWEYIGRILSYNEPSDNPSMQNNGGSYGFWGYTYYFRNENSIRMVVKHFTTAEFDYDELEASFQSTICASCINADFHANIQQDYSDDQDFLLESVSTIVDVKEIDFSLLEK